MNKVKIILNEDEFDVFQKNCPCILVGEYDILQLSENINVLLTSEQAIDCAEIMQDIYIFEGFDDNYEHTKLGLLYRKIIDKFIDAGI